MGKRRIKGCRSSVVGDGDGGDEVDEGDAVIEGVDIRGFNSYNAVDNDDDDNDVNGDDCVGVLVDTGV